MISQPWHILVAYYMILDIQGQPTKYANLDSDQLLQASVPPAWDRTAEAARTYTGQLPFSMKKDISALCTMSGTLKIGE